MSTFEYGTEIETPTPSSLMKQLQQDLAQPLEDELVNRKIRRRPQYEITYSKELDWEEYKVAEASAIRTDPKTKQKYVDQLALATYLVSAQCQSIKLNGEVIYDGDEPLTFRSTSFTQIQKAPSQKEAISKFFGEDWDIIRHKNVILATEEEGEGLDPTA